MGWAWGFLFTLSFFLVHPSLMVDGVKRIKKVTKEMAWKTIPNSRMFHPLSLYSVHPIWGKRKRRVSSGNGSGAQSSLSTSFILGRIANLHYVDSKDCSFTLLTPHFH
ncbi:hypothetical protein L6164_031245 [Bauhinia variegata]|uniref:Uncharacterized protein n=1 Tax=Bauhinia variegata TaxID=167791 RepID=A0ACB9LEE2_BAUVA|nr:hypothetical protein L6164_031245 [Bauhinia variegata]